MLTACPAYNIPSGLIIHAMKSGSRNEDIGSDKTEMLLVERPVRQVLLTRPYMSANSWKGNRIWSGISLQDKSRSLLMTYSRSRTACHAALLFSFSVMSFSSLSTSCRLCSRFSRQASYSSVSGFCSNLCFNSSLTIVSLLISFIFQAAGVKHVLLEDSSNLDIVWSLHFTSLLFDVTHAIIVCVDCKIVDFLFSLCGFDVLLEHIKLLLCIFTWSGSCLSKVRFVINL